jgi:predicted translin family RNA/ssDNA-binding protein
MIDTAEFLKLVKQMNEFESKREQQIKKSRDIIKLSKQVIYSVHREDLKAAESLIKDIKKELALFKKNSEQCPKLLYSGTFKVTIQEFVEAVSFYELIKNKKLPKFSDFSLDEEYYLLGLCDLTGEVVRKAINSAIKGDYKTTLALKEFVSDLYGEFMKFDFSNGDLRKKYDSMKYDLKKLEDLVLELKLKGKI